MHHQNYYIAVKFPTLIGFNLTFKQSVVRKWIDNYVQILHCDSHGYHWITISIGGGIRGALGALAPTKFVSAHRNLVFHNRNVSC